MLIPLIFILAAGALIGAFTLGYALPSLQHFARGRAAAARLFHVINRHPADLGQPDVDAPGDVLEEVTGALELRNVAFAYPARPDIQARGVALGAWD